MTRYISEGEYGIAKYSYQKRGTLLDILKTYYYCMYHLPLKDNRERY